VAEDLTAISHQIQYKDPKPPSEIIPKIPRPMDGILARALTKSPADRYPSGQALAEDLLAVRQGEKPRMAVVPGEKTRTQTNKTARELETSSETAAVGVLESLGTPSSSPGFLRWLVPGLVLVGALIYASVVGSDRVSEQAQWLLGQFRGFSASVGRQLDQWNEAYQETRVEQERVEEMRFVAEGLLERSGELEKRGQWGEALALCEQSLQVFRQAEDGVGEASALLARGRIESQKGNWTQARSDLDAARSVYRIYEEPAGQVKANLLLGNLERDLGNGVRAQALYGQALNVAGSLDGYRLCGEVRLHSALQDMLQGRWEPAREGLDAVRRDAGEKDEDELATAATFYLGILSHATGNREMSRTWWEEGRRGCRERADLDCLSELELWEGRAALESGDVAAARRHFEEAEQHFRKVDDLPGLAAALENLMEIALREGNDIEAQGTLEILSSVRAQLGLAELRPRKEKWMIYDDDVPSAEESEGDPHRRRLGSIMRAIPRTALTEERIAQLQPAVPEETPEETTEPISSKDWLPQEQKGRK
jgi:tetratricopeptide (TPR) repeat protein